MRPEIKVGLTVLAALILVYLALAWVKRAHFFSPPEQVYQIQFSNVNGLLEGDPVTVRGFISGRVNAIKPQTDNVLVSISLDRRVTLYSDAEAVIQLKELMGSKQIELHPGTSGELLPVAKTIPGQIALDFSTAFSQFDTLMNQLPPGQMEQMIGDVRTLLHNLSSLTSTLEKAELDQMLGDLAATLKDTRRLMARIESSGIVDEGTNLVRRADTTLGSINELAEGMKRKTLPRADSTLDELRLTLVAARQTIDEFDQVVAALNDSSGMANRLLTDPGLYDRLDTTITNLNLALEAVHSGKVIIGINRKNNK